MLLDAEYFYLCILSFSFDLFLPSVQWLAGALANHWTQLREPRKKDLRCSLVHQSLTATFSCHTDDNGIIIQIRFLSSELTLNLGDKKAPHGTFSSVALYHFLSGVTVICMQLISPTRLYTPGGQSILLFIFVSFSYCSWHLTQSTPCTRKR